MRLDGVLVCGDDDRVCVRGRLEAPLETGAEDAPGATAAEGHRAHEVVLVLVFAVALGAGRQARVIVGGVGGH